MPGDPEPMHGLTCQTHSTAVCPEGIEQGPQEPPPQTNWKIAIHGHLHSCEKDVIGHVPAEKPKTTEAPPHETVPFHRGDAAAAFLSILTVLYGCTLLVSVAFHSLWKAKVKNKCCHLAQP